MTVVWFVLGRHSRKTETEKKSEKPVSVAKAVRGNDLRAVRDNVLAWARKAFPDAEVRNLAAVAALADDRAFAGELKKLQQALYSGRGEGYNQAAFMEAFAAADKRRCGAAWRRKIVKCLQSPVCRFFPLIAFLAENLGDLEGMGLNALVPEQHCPAPLIMVKRQALPPFWNSGLPGNV